MKARAGSAQAKRKAARVLVAAFRLEQLAERCEKVAEQIQKRLAGERITDRLVGRLVLSLGPAVQRLNSPTVLIDPTARAGSSHLARAP